jgi:hypothetical protein
MAICTQYLLIVTLITNTSVSLALFSSLLAVVLLLLSPILKHKRNRHLLNITTFIVIALSFLLFLTFLAAPSILLGVILSLIAPDSSDQASILQDPCGTLQNIISLPLPITAAWFVLYLVAFGIAYKIRQNIDGVAK